MSDTPNIPIVTSFVIETNLGGIPITLCSCGLLIYQPMAQIHMEVCQVYQLYLRPADPNPAKDG